MKIGILKPNPNSQTKPEQNGTIYIDKWLLALTTWRYPHYIRACLSNHMALRQASSMIVFESGGGGGQINPKKS